MRMKHLFDYLFHYRYETDAIQQEENLQDAQLIQTSNSDDQNNNTAFQFPQNRKEELSLPLKSEYWPAKGK